MELAIRAEGKNSMFQVEFINKTGLDRRTVQNYELAERTPVLKNVRILAKALNMTPGTLVDLVFEELDKHSDC